jgi:hypothetical protein
MKRFGVSKGGVATFLGLVVVLTFWGTATAANTMNIADCDQTMDGPGLPYWRQISDIAGPLGFPDNALQRMSRTGNGQMVAKAPILIEGHAVVTVSVPARLRHRVFLYYGRILDRNGNLTTSFTEASGYSTTEFQPCTAKPRTVWPGGVRVRGRAPVRLLVRVQGQSASIPLHLGRPKVYPPLMR